MGTLRPDVTHAEPARRAREPAVGDQRDLLAHALAGQGRRGGQHLTHARASSGAFVADHDHLAFLVFTPFHSLERVLFTFEDPGRASEALLLGAHARDLHDCAFRGKVALEANHAAGGRDRRFDRIDDLAVGLAPDHVELLAHGSAAGRNAVLVDQPGLLQFLHDHRHTTGLVEVLGHIFTARLEVHEIGRVLENLANVEKVEVDPGLMGNRGQVQAGIG